MYRMVRTLIILLLSGFVLLGTFCSSSFAGWKTFDGKDFSVRIDFVHDNMPELDYEHLNWLITESWWWENPKEAKDWKNEGQEKGIYVRFQLKSEEKTISSATIKNKNFTYDLYYQDMYDTWRAYFASQKYYSYSDIESMFSSKDITCEVQFEDGKTQDKTFTLPNLPDAYNDAFNTIIDIEELTKGESIKYTADKADYSGIEIFTYEGSSYTRKYHDYENAEGYLHQPDKSKFQDAKKYFYTIFTNENYKNGINFRTFYQGIFADNTNIANSQLAGDYRVLQLESANGTMFTADFEMSNYENGNSTWISPSENGTTQFTAYENGRVAWSPYHRGAYAQDSNVFHYSEYIPHGDQGIFVGIKDGSSMDKSTLNGEYIVCESQISDTYPKTSIIQIDFEGNGEFSGTVIEDPDSIHADDKLNGTYEVENNGEIILNPDSSDDPLLGKVSPDGDVFVHGGERYYAIGLRKGDIAEHTLRGDYLISEVGLHSVDALWSSYIKAEADGYGYIEGTVLGTTDPDLNVGDTVSSNYYIGSEYGLLTFSEDESKGIALADGSMFVLCSPSQHVLRIGTRSPSKESQQIKAELNFEKHKLRQSDKLYYEYSRDASEVLNEEWNEGNIEWILNAIDEGIPYYYYVESEIEVSKSISSELVDLQLIDSAGNTYDCLLDEEEEEGESNATEYQYVISTSGDEPYTTSSFFKLKKRFNGLITLNLHLNDGTIVTKYINASQFYFPNLPVVVDSSLGDTSKFEFHNSTADTYSVKVFRRDDKHWDEPLNSSEEIESYPGIISLSTKQDSNYDSMYIADLQKANHYGDYHFETQSIRYSYATSNNNAPDNPDLNKPFNGTESITTTPTLRAGNFTDPDGDSHKLTIWHIKNATNATVLNLETNSALTSLEVPDFALDHNATYKWQACYLDDLNKQACSGVYEFTTKLNTEDDDGNGVPDEQQPAKENETVSGDKVVQCTSDSSKQVGVNSTDDSKIETMKSVDPEQYTDTDNKPSDLPFDLIATRIKNVEEGGVARVTINYSEPIPSNPAYYKYDSVRGWYEFEDAEFHHDNQSVTLRLVDGGPGDADGVANGVIVDPGGVSQTTTSDGTTSSSGGGGGGGCIYEPAASGGWSWILLLLIPALTFAARTNRRLMS